MIALAVTVATAVASPCDEAEKGTYLSNVCWLLDDYSRDAFPSHRVASVDPDNCTVTTTRNEVINFMKSDGNVQIILDGTAMCWKLFGKGIHIYPDISKDDGSLWVGRSLKVCGRPMEQDRINRALNNLFTKYCPIEGQEF